MAEQHVSPGYFEQSIELRRKELEPVFAEFAATAYRVYETLVPHAVVGFRDNAPLTRMPIKNDRYRSPYPLKQDRLSIQLCATEVIDIYRYYDNEDHYTVPDTRLGYSAAGDVPLLLEVCKTSRPSAHAEETSRFAVREFPLFLFFGSNYDFDVTAVKCISGSLIRMSEIRCGTINNYKEAEVLLGALADDLRLAVRTYNPDC